MSADAIIMEALARIEHKLDLLLEAQDPKAGAWLYKLLGDMQHKCPVCTKQVTYVLDIFRQAVNRVCGCTTGKVPPLNMNMNPIPETKKDDNGNTSEESWLDTPGSRRRGRKR